MKDFVNPQADLFAASSHGLGVLSCIGMNQPGIMTGTAPEASFWLFRSEDEASEHLVEQDYWAAAVEFADSVGVDVLNTSLGLSLIHIFHTHHSSLPMPVAWHHDNFFRL